MHNTDLDSTIFGTGFCTNVNNFYRGKPVNIQNQVMTSIMCRCFWENCVTFNILVQFFNWIYAFSLHELKKKYCFLLTAMVLKENYSLFKIGCRKEIAFIDCFHLVVDFVLRLQLFIIIVIIFAIILIGSDKIISSLQISERIGSWQRWVMVTKLYLKVWIWNHKLYNFVDVQNYELSPSTCVLQLTKSLHELK